MIISLSNMLLSNIFRIVVPYIQNIVKFLNANYFFIIWLLLYTICPISLDPFYIVTYYIDWVNRPIWHILVHTNLSLNLILKIIVVKIIWSEYTQCWIVLNRKICCHFFKNYSEHYSTNHKEIIHYYFLMAFLQNVSE